MPGRGRPLSPSEVDCLRQRYPSAPDVVHLNHAGASPSSTDVLTTYVSHLRREAQIGGYEAADEERDADAAVYGSIARMLRCRPGEIARMEHATAAWNAAFWSVPMRAGERILTAEAAYGANAIAFLHAEQQRGVRVDVVPSDATGQIDLGELAARIDDDVALIALTHVPTNGGLVNPAAAVGALARSASVPFLLDACQSVGQLELDVAELGCDMLSATGRKYLRGPRGTGFLYVSDKIVDRLVPAQPDLHGATWDSTRSFELMPGAKRFEHWEYNHAAWLALGAAVDEALAMGIDRIEATVRQQAESLRAALADAGMKIHDLGTDRCGIVTATMPTMDSHGLRADLLDAGINTSVTTPNSTRWDFERRELEPMLRLSVHATTTDDEIERTAEELRSIGR